MNFNCFQLKTLFKVWLLVGGILLLLPKSYAQQDVQYTQFMHNKLGLNPGMAGSKGLPVVYGLIRKQWFGVAGAPASQSFGYHIPLKGRNVGLGLMLANDQIGFTRMTQINASYAYHLRVQNKMYLAAGLHLSGKQYRVDWRDVKVTDSDDPSVPDVEQSSRLLANFGTGVLLYNDDFYVGLSVPKLMRNRLDFSETGPSTLNKEEIHTYLMGGLKYNITPGITLKPAALVKYVPRAPIDLDVHMGVQFAKILDVGATYRFGGSMTRTVGESIDLLAGFQINPRLRTAVSYDITLTDIRKQTTGSAELFLEYGFLQVGNKLTNPRFF